MLPPYSVFDTPQVAVSPAAAAEYVPYASYRPNASSVKDRLYIAKLKRAEEELKQVKEENAQLKKENTALIELLPGRRGGYRKRTIRRKRN